MSHVLFNVLTNVLVSHVQCPGVLVSHVQCLGVLVSWCPRGTLVLYKECFAMHSSHSVSKVAQEDQHIVQLSSSSKFSITLLCAPDWYVHSRTHDHV